MNHNEKLLNVSIVKRKVTTIVKEVEGALTQLTDVVGLLVRIEDTPRKEADDLTMHDIQSSRTGAADNRGAAAPGGVSTDAPSNLETSGNGP